MLHTFVRREVYKNTLLWIFAETKMFAQHDT